MGDEGRTRRLLEAAAFQKKLASYFNDYLSERRSEKTMEHYRVVMTRFVRHVAATTGKKLDAISFRDISKETVEGFIGRLREDGLVAASCNNYLSVIRSFMKYSATGDVTVDPSGTMMVEKLREQKDLTVKYLEMGALAAILKQPDRSTEEGMRDHMFLVLMYDTGCRLSEMIDLRIRDIVLKKGGSYAVIENGKGGKKRKAPVSDRIALEISSYIEEFHMDSHPDDHMFFQTRRNGSRIAMTPYKAEAIVKAAADKARESCPLIPERVTCHMFRHSRAMHLYRGGMSISLISQLLGHSSVNTTMIYAYADTEMKRKAIEKAVDEKILPSAETKVKAESYDEKSFLKSVGLID